MNNATLISLRISVPAIIIAIAAAASPVARPQGNQEVSQEPFLSQYGNYSLTFKPFKYGFSSVIGGDNLLVDKPWIYGSDLFQHGTVGALLIAWFPASSISLTEVAYLSSERVCCTNVRLSAQSAQDTITIDGRNGRSVWHHYKSENDNNVTLTTRIRSALVRNETRDYTITLIHMLAATSKNPAINGEIKSQAKEQKLFLQRADQLWTSVISGIRFKNQ